MARRSVDVIIATTERRGTMSLMLALFSVPCLQLLYRCEGSFCYQCCRSLSEQLDSIVTEFNADMDVAVMKKSSVRLFTIGGFLLLGSFAFALAHHDSRNRSRISEDSKISVAQPAVPIAVEDSPQKWDPTPEHPMLVRANNNELNVESESEPAPAPEPFDNPLRGPAFDKLSESAVVTASGTEPVQTAPTSTTPQLPAGPPSWLTDIQQPAAPAPASNTNALPGQAANIVPPSGLPKLPNAAQLPNTGPSMPQATAGAVALPTFPMGAIEQLPAAEPLAANATLQVPINGSTPFADGPAQSFPQAATGQFALPAAPNNLNAVNMSDTQRQAMQPTNLKAPPSNSINAIGAANNSNARHAGSFPANNPAGSASFASTTGQAARSSQEFQTVATGGVHPPAAMTGLVSNEPGNRYLDGSQNPIMLIHKRGPEEVRVGRKSTFVITVRNAGNSAAQEVTVTDSVPSGMRFAEASPSVTPTAEGILTWKLGEMPPGDERTINLQMIPERQGELGSVASVQFAAQASVRTVATLPRLELQIDAQPESLIGDTQLIAVTVKNTGTGVARGVRLEADLPSQLRHESGDQHLEAVFPRDLAPNQSERLELRSLAAQPGEAICKVRAITEDGTQAEQQVAVMVLAPSLTATIEGPRLRYLDRQATYRFKVQNTGTAAATNLDFVVRLPSGLRFNAADNRLADYSPADHTVTIGLAELPVGQIAPFELTVLPVERGPQVITLNVNADLGATTEAKGQVVVEGLPELAFTIGQDNGTIETGTSTTYSVQITNIGNNPDKDVRLAVLLPKGAQFVRVVEAPVEYRVEGNQIVFAPIPEIGNKDQRTFRFEIRHTQPGTQIVRTQVTSANWPVAIVKEEGTLVYDDQN